MIKQKKGICISCGNKKTIYAKKKCTSCYQYDYAKEYSQKQQLKQKAPELSRSKKTFLAESKLRSKIKSRSKRNSWSDNEGRRYNSLQIERKIRLSKIAFKENFISENGFVYCEDCYPDPTTQGSRIDISHTISVDQAKKTGNVQLCWDWRNNFRFLCRKHHQIHDNLI